MRNTARMPSEQRRKTYTREFVDELFVCHAVSESSSSQDGHDEQTKTVLEELFAQSMLDLEKRFTLYWKKLSSETDIDNLRDVISRSEKRLNARFYQEVESGKRPKANHAYRLALKNCLVMLERDLYGNQLIEDLFISKIVTLSEKSSIQNAGNRRRQNNELLTFLAGRLTYEEFHNIFLPALSKDHKHLADMLISELDRIEEEIEESKCVSCRTRQYVQVKRLAAPLLDMKAISLTMYSELRNVAVTNNTKWAELKHEVPDDKIINALEKKYPDFYKEFQRKEVETLECCCQKHEEIVPEIEGIAPASDEENSESGSGITPMDFIEEEGDNFLDFQEEDQEQEYKMSASQRGLCLIINNKSDIPNTKTNDDKLENTFKRLQFSVCRQSNLTAENMKRSLREYSQMDHSSFDAFMCVIISRGNENGLLGYDGETVPLSELMSYFKASLCPSLAGKPKIFLVEASRGNKIMNFKVIEDKTFADDADFLVGQSSTEGFQSYRKGEKQVFINKLTDTLDNCADQNDFLSCLTKVTKRVARIRLMRKDTRQVPSVVSTLTKKLHLTIDPHWPHPKEQENQPS